MKIKSIFKLFATVGITTAAGLSVGLFVDMIPDSYSNVKILTKETYKKWVASSENVRERPAIDYGLLPTSQYSFRQILDNPKSVNGGNFIFFFGSQAYKTTNSMLWGIDKDFIVGEGSHTEVNSSIMHKLYESFWDDDKATALGLNKVDPVFLNYVDMVNTKELQDAYNLKIKRARSLGNFETNIAYRDPTTGDITANIPEELKKDYVPWPNADAPQVWYKIDRFHWQVGEDRDIQKVEVVRGVRDEKSPSFTEFDFKPDSSSYYEWRPDDKKDTEYKKVYYRNTHEVANFNANYAFMESYLSKVYSKSGANKEGMILCVRNLDVSKYKKETIDNPFDIKIISSAVTDKPSIDRTLNEVVSFYNPDFNPDEDNNNSSSTPDSSTPDSSTPPPATSRTVVHQKDYAINQLTDNLGEMNKNLATIEIKK